MQWVHLCISVECIYTKYTKDKLVCYLYLTLLHKYSVKDGARGHLGFLVSAEGNYLADVDKVLLIRPYCDPGSTKKGGYHTLSAQ